MNVLVVDDDRAQLRLWSLILAAAGHDVRTAASRREAQAELAERPPDVLLMDLRMPRMEDGFALIRAASGCGGKIVVLSGWPEDLEGRPEAEQVARVLLKPIPTAALLEALRKSKVKSQKSKVGLVVARASACSAETLSAGRLTNRGRAETSVCATSLTIGKGATLAPRATYS